MIARSRGLKPADDMPVSPCVAGNQDADNLHGDDLHEDASERRTPFARDRWFAFGPQVGRWRAAAVEHVRAG